MEDNCDIAGFTMLPMKNFIKEKYGRQTALVGFTMLPTLHKNITKPPKNYIRLLLLTDPKKENALPI